MINSIKNRINIFISKLSSRQQLLLLIVGVLLLAILYYVLTGTDTGDTNINYNDINVQQIIDNSVVEYDRGRIETLNVIINNILNVNNDMFLVEDKTITINDLYKYATSENYRNYLSRGSFKRKIQTLYSKVFNGYNDINYIPLEMTIKCVYYSEYYDNMYLVELYDNDEQNNTYLGIGLNESKNRFYIMYIE